MADDQPPKAARSLREDLKKTLDESEWSWLAPHLVRDAIILVSHDLDLLTVGETVSRDEKGTIQEWIAQGFITKPTREQIEAWTKTPTKKFLTLIVQPYVLAQEHLLH